jgi:hypothetical protein
MLMKFIMTCFPCIADILYVTEHSATKRAFRVGDHRGGGEGVPAIGGGAAG